MNLTFDDGSAVALINAACADNGALLHYVAESVLGLSVVASALANLRRAIPGPLLAVLDAFALNFVKNLKKEPSP